MILSYIVFNVVAQLASQLLVVVFFEAPFVEAEPKLFLEVLRYFGSFLVTLRSFDSLSSLEN